MKATACTANKIRVYVVFFTAAPGRAVKTISYHESREGAIARMNLERVPGGRHVSFCSKLVSGNSTRRHFRILD